MNNYSDPPGGGGLAVAKQKAQKSTVLDSDDFAKVIADKHVRLIDVRTRSEFVSGHIPGAINIDVNSPGFDKETAVYGKEGPLAVYCLSGMRAKAAAGKLAAKGFTVYELDGGIRSWNGKIVK